MALGPASAPIARFADLIAERTQHFTGRQWVFATLSRWLADPAAPRLFLLTGGPGSGKTALAARLAQMSLGAPGVEPAPGLGAGFLAYYHFCQAKDDPTLAPLRFVEALSLALAQRYPSFAHALLASPQREITIIQNVGAVQPGGRVTGIESVHIGDLPARSAFDWAVRRPLEALCTPEFTETITILVDSLDEALTFSADQSIAHLLNDVTDSPHELPRQARFVLTSRPDERVLALFGQPSLDLIDNAPADVDDVRDYALRRLAVVAQPQRTNLAQRIAAAGAGNFLYARYVLDDLLARPALPANLDVLALPAGLEGVYRDFLDRELRRSRQHWQDAYRPLLGLLCVARAPGLAREHLLVASGLRASQVDDALAACSQYLAGNRPGGPFSIYHQSLRDFLLTDPAYNVYPAEAEQQLGEALFEVHKDQWASCADGYAVRHTPGHLARAAQALTQPFQRADRLRLEQAVAATLMDYGWLRARLHETDIAALLADFDLLPAAPNVALVRDALRLSAHVLARDNAQLPSQLHGRLCADDGPAIAHLLAQACRAPAAPWLRPLHPTLTAPGGPLLRTFAGHTGPLNAVVVLPDGRRALSGSQDNMLKLWDVETGACLLTFEGHTGAVTAVAVLADGRRVLSGSLDNMLKLWDVETGACLRTFAGHGGRVNAVVALADGRCAVSAGGSTLRLWDVETGACLRTFEGHGGAVWAVALLPGGRSALSASEDKTLKLWDLDTGACLCTLAGHASWVTSAAVLGDGQRALSASGDKTLKLWDLQTGHCLYTFEGHGDWVRAVVVLSDGRRALSASQDWMLKLWDLETGACLRTFEGHTAPAVALAALEDDRRVLSASWDHTLKLWDVETDVCLRSWEGHANGVEAVAALGNGQRALSASADNTLKLWDVQTGACLRTFEGHAAVVTTVAALGDGRRALSGSWDHTLKLWDVETGDCLRTFEGHRLWVLAVAALPDGRRALSGSADATLKLWDVKTGACLRTLRGHTNWVRAVAALPDGRRALSGSDDRTLKLWDVETGDYLRTFEGHTAEVHAVAVLPDGRRVLSGSDDGTLKLWDVETGACLRTLDGRSGDMHAVAVLGDGRRALSGSDDNTLKLWDVETGQVIATFTVEGAVEACAAAQDDTIIAGDAAGRVHLLRLEGWPPDPPILRGKHSPGPV